MALYPTIHTHVLSPTGRYGARVVATHDAGRVYLPYDYRAPLERNHAAAAEKLARKLGFEGKWFPGFDKGGGYVFVHVYDDEPASFDISNTTADNDGG